MNTKFTNFFFFFFHVELESCSRLTSGFLQVCLLWPYSWYLEKFYLYVVSQLGWALLVFGLLALHLTKWFCAFDTFDLFWYLPCVLIFQWINNSTICRKQCFCPVELRSVIVAILFLVFYYSHCMVAWRLIHLESVACICSILYVYYEWLLHIRYMESCKTLWLYLKSQ